jgi:hypothetical protein
MIGHGSFDFGSRAESVAVMWRSFSAVNIATRCQRRKCFAPIAQLDRALVYGFISNFQICSIPEHFSKFKPQHPAKKRAKRQGSVCKCLQGFLQTFANTSKTLNIGPAYQRPSPRVL